MSVICQSRGVWHTPENNHEINPRTFRAYAIRPYKANADIYMFFKNISV